MKIQPKIRTQQEVDNCVAGISGTWVKRRNARVKLTNWSNEIVNKEISIQKAMIRHLKAQGATQKDLSPHFSEITKLELKLL